MSSHKDNYTLLFSYELLDALFIPEIYPACQALISFSEGSSDREETYLCISILAFLAIAAASLSKILFCRLSLILYLLSSVDKI
jgi:hypothetical protein